MSQILEQLYAVVWGIPALVLILGVGLYLSVRTGFVQLRLFGRACTEFVRRLRPEIRTDTGISSFQALCTALAATVGTGNIAGVAGAIAIGGPGAIFWMWICGLLGMVVKLAEATLSVRYRVRENGEFYGGPMYMIRNGMKKRWLWLGTLYSFFGVIAALGVGNATQINAVLTGINNCIVSFGGVPSRSLDLLLGCAMALIVLVLLLGGAKRVGNMTEVLVPFAAVAYFLLGIIVLLLRSNAIPTAFTAIFRGAFSPNAITGGMIGSFLVTLRVGVSRGVFTNEAGMGTAGIAHAGADVRHPVEQGLMGMVEVFLDTIVICTMTALVILCSGVGIPYGATAGAELTMESFSIVLGDWVRIFITLSLCLFAFATVLGWGLYGARCAQYLFGHKAWKLFSFIQAATVILGVLLNTGTAWLMAEIVNGLMAIPNLIVLIVLSPELSRLIIDFQRKTGNKAGGGTLCRYPSTQTVVSPRLCGNSTHMRWPPRQKARKYTT